MLYFSTFEVYVMSVKNKYERLTGASFLEDFGHSTILDLRKSFERGHTVSEVIEKLMNKHHRFNRCCCECGNVSQAYS